MDDKMFDLMSKIYGELTEFRKDTDKRFSSLETDVGSLKTDVRSVKNDIIRLENKLDNSTKILFDGYEQTFEKIVNIEKEVKDLSSKVEKQEVEIKVIKGGK
jgi:septal ring factor EnvC (AmiA/AmiB activator)